jgi:predicted Rdx family selenoprotein
VIEDLQLVTSSGGAFEVKVDDELIFSKKNVHRRHAEPGEILGLFKEIIGPDVPTYPNE